jgi:lipoic acid synthetase
MADSKALNADAPGRPIRFTPVDKSKRHETLGERPERIKISLRGTPEYVKVRKLMRGLALTTVCEEARCPNIYECWSYGTSTFMINGDRCTRTCGFCAIESLRPPDLDPAEPANVAEAVAHLELNHAVITAVNRDDIPDGGAAQFVETIEHIRKLRPTCTIEVLIPDFEGNDAAIDAVFDAGPDVLNHNVETVPDLYRTVRPQARYATTLALLRRAADRREAGQNMVVKCGMMVGLGEAREQVSNLLRDLRAVSVDVLTVGQYLSPTLKHLPVRKWYTSEEFDSIRDEALSLGFEHVESGAMVRSSYKAHAHVPESFKRK